MTTSSTTFSVAWEASGVVAKLRAEPDEVVVGHRGDVLGRLWQLDGNARLNRRIDRVDQP